MSRILIHGGRKLFGSVCVQGSKNSTLPVMAACLLNAGITVLRNYPSIADVDVMQEILEYIGCVINRDEEELVIDTRNASPKPITAEMTGKLRASSVLIGPMLARFGQVQIAHPGGCNIGSRPLDIHMAALKQLGASWEMSEKGIYMRAAKLAGNEIMLRFPSVGATENAVMAAVGACGQTVIYNAAKEPEIVSLCEYLRETGAEISGDGTGKIVIWGGRELSDCIYQPPADRIVAGTYMAAVAACQGTVLLKGCKVSDCRGFLDVYTGMGMSVCCMEDGIQIEQSGRCVNLHRIDTGPYPGFPTDMQSLTMSAAAAAEGTLIIKEQIFESRFKTAEWLNEMGADIEIAGCEAYIHGVPKLQGASVEGADLRGTAALVVAGLCAQGETVVGHADYIRRGYTRLCEHLRGLGADIGWEND